MFLQCQLVGSPYSLQINTEVRLAVIQVLMAQDRLDRIHIASVEHLVPWIRPARPASSWWTVALDHVLQVAIGAGGSGSSAARPARRNGCTVPANGRTGRAHA